MEDHSFGPTCVYHKEEPDTTQSAGSKPPRVKAQFFYVSPLPIDDPLSPLPPIANEKTKYPPKPFSLRDNAALEEAWQNVRLVGEGSGKSPSTSRPGTGRGIFSFPKFAEGVKSPAAMSPHEDQDEIAILSLDANSTVGDSKTMLGAGSEVTGVDQRPVSQQELENEDASHLQVFTTLSKKRHLSPFRRISKGETSSLPGSLSSSPRRREMDEQQGAQTMPSDISGRPFARAPSGRNVNKITTAGVIDTATSPNEDFKDMSITSDSNNLPEMTRKGQKSLVPVGVSRLHLVELPELEMKPIYWSPINDTSNVLRCTWFYKETMLPVPAQIANLLELGYEYIKPYADSYQDELQACIDNGASAEMKVVHKLWPEALKMSRPGTAADNKLDDVSEDTSAGILPVHLENVAADPNMKNDKHQFQTHSVIYTDHHNAQILRPNLLPSVRQNRRPLSSIRKGRQIGIAVVRGFDRKAYYRLHPEPKLDARSAHAKVGGYLSQSGDATTRSRRMSCAACEGEAQPPKVSDLVLVIHGIGQKLSERVDSFHFTHAINGLRREFNVELSAEAVKGTLETDSGIMVLPVNWRLTLSFDDDIKTHATSDEAGKYDLKDITPDSLPAVRSIISDVMLDIPYYLSHHKDKMTSAVIREANRVYRLWCRNNPGFQESGRVHIIAHSLGSVMAMEILSKQPTKVDSTLDLDKSTPSDTQFEFNTTDLFCCGSPCGFFLLLNNAHLVPRKGLDKIGMEGEDHGHGIAGEPSYGCLAVQNIYNISHRNDPVSYLMNASVDSDYASSLQPASIPSASIGFFSRMGNTMRWNSTINNAYNTKALPERPTMQHMPSTVEMETHNFSREEIAEKRMYLLNENGQIDYYLSSAGGPLEIQYLSMLSAHSSYWILQDFVRFLVVEIGRKSGKQNTIPVLRAVKKREWKHGNLAG